MRFWDASAIVPLLVDEPTRPRLVRLLTDDPSVVVWWATEIECTSAIVRREREGMLAQSAATAALVRLRRLSDGWNEVTPSQAVRERARRLLRVHPLRAADSLQLAAALIAAEDSPHALEIVCLDDRLADAARREGFGVVGI